MKKRKSSLATEVGELVEECVVVEACQKVWDRTQGAMDKLDPESRQLLEAYFGGMTTDELAKETKLDKQKLEDWIAKAKRELINHLRNGLQMKQ